MTTRRMTSGDALKHRNGLYGFALDFRFMDAAISDERGVPHWSDSAIESNFHALQNLIHGLCEKTTLTTTEAIEIVNRAVEVQPEKADLDGVQASGRQALDHLASIAASLRVDED